MSIKLWHLLLSVFLTTLGVITIIGYVLIVYIPNMPKTSDATHDVTHEEETEENTESSHHSHGHGGH